MMFRHSPSLQTITATRSVHRHAERSFHPVATAATPTPARRAGRAAARRVVRRLVHCVAPDGRTLLIGVKSNDLAHVVDNGSAWVFRRDAGAWPVEAQLRAAYGTAGDFFGTSVALAEPVDAAGAIGPEGGLALCGSIFDAPDGPPDDLVKRGSATLFRRTKGAWTERATLVAADSAAGDECGVSVALGSGGAPGASLALVGGVRGVACPRKLIHPL